MRAPHTSTFFGTKTNMALVHANATVGSTPTLVLVMPNGVPYTAVNFSNGDNSTMYLGDASIATTGANHGSVLASGASVQLWLNGGDKVWAISATGSTAGALSIIYSGI